MSSMNNDELRAAMRDERLVLEVDGDMFCCHRPNFINLQESPAGFGKTPEAAVQDFLTYLMQNE